MNKKLKSYPHFNKSRILPTYWIFIIYERTKEGRRKEG
jgi:hypothetical protein